MDIDDLTGRKKKLLKVLIELYIRYGKPIGSGIIARECELGLSSATIRLELAELEVMGYLRSPNIASGRLPTKKGIKLYISELMQKADIEDSKMKIEIEIEKHVGKDFFETMFFISSLLAKLSNYAGLMYGPFLRNTIIKRIELIPINEKKVVGILITKSGIILHKKILLTDKIDKWDLYKITNYLNEKLEDIDFYKMEEYIREEQRNKPYELPLFSETILHIIQSFNDLENKNQILKIGGIKNVIKLMENISKNSLVKFLTFVEEGKLKLLLSSHKYTKGINITISDREIGYLCAIITKNFLVGDNYFGVVGVLGPVRMKYNEVIPLIEFTSERLSYSLTSTSIGI
jgi:heat-inducible transcriptional repressor